jgi:2-desacetyl-2-hydroxyethyl bacteriochlorophyllide A dehydrogenase
MGECVISLQVVITSPFQVDVRETALSEPAEGEVRLRTSVTGISAGTELLAYRGQLPTVSPGDAAIDPHAGSGDYPMQTGYCSVGFVDAVGSGVNPEWQGKRVFAFQPHQTYSIARPDALVALPDEIGDELATFIPNLETAIGLVMDGAPMLGERVVVLGQGVVGQLVTRLLARYPLAYLVTADVLPARREWSLVSGAARSVDPSSQPDRDRLLSELTSGGSNPGADLVFELSGNPAALNDAIQLAGFGGRIVAGSWFGSKPTQLDLGGRFHRNRISLISSQVSTIAPGLTARWTKDRRMREVLRLLPKLDLGELVTHRFALGNAADAFALLDESPEDVMQVVLTCND